MTKLEEGLNKKFGRLTPVEIIKEKGKNAKYRCVCDCRNEIITWYNNLYLGKTVSCGCWNDEQRHRKDNKSHNIKHGMANTRVYREWCAMRNRCTSKSNISYKNYGGRGITICDEWLNDFMNFYNWAMKNGYKDGNLIYKNLKTETLIEIADPEAAKILIVGTGEGTRVFIDDVSDMED